MSVGLHILYLVPYINSIVISAAIAVYAWRRRSVDGAEPFAIRSSAQVLRVVGFILILISPALARKVFWDNIHLLGTVVQPIATLIFAMDYTGRKFRHRKATLITLLIIPTILMVLALTDNAHGLIRQNAQIFPDRFFPGLVYDYTLTLWAYVLFGYALIFISFFLLIEKFIRSQSLYRSQIGMIILGLSLPILGLGLTLSGVIVYRYTIAYFATIGDAIILWSLFRYRMFDITPVAHHAIFRSMIDGVIILNNQQRLADYNPAAKSFVSRLSPDLIGQPAGLAFADYPNLVERFGNVDNLFTELEVQTNLGQRCLEISISPLTNQSGRTLGRMIVIHDITDQKQVQAALAKSEEEYRRLVESSPDWIWAIDADGTHAFSNQGITAILGYPPEEVISKLSFPLMHPDEQERIQQMVHDAVKNKQGWEDLVIRWVHKDGSIRYLESRGEPIFDSQGKLKGFSGMDRDVTARVMAEEEVNRYATQLEAANKELEAFSYSVSHDLRAPLRSVTGFSQILIDNKMNTLDQEGQDQLKRVHESSLRMGELIDDLLVLSRVSRSEMIRSSVDLSGIAQNIFGGLQETDPERQAAITIEPGLRVEGDMRLLRIMLENLLGNAWKFTSGKEQAEITFGAEEIEGQSIFFIQDNGVGFDMAYVDKIFDPFQRLHSSDDFEGTGIGLATVQRIIYRHEGRVWAKGAVGQGATIYFTL